MKIQNYFLSAMLVGTVAMSAMPTMAFAQTTAPSTAKAEKSAARCSKVTGKIDALITKLQNDESVRQGRHQKTIDRLNTVIAKLEANNINADKLKADVATLTAKKTEWQAEYTATLSKLNASKQFACGESQGQFVQAVKDARAQQKVKHSTNMDFWGFVKNTVRPDIQAIRSQLKTSTK